MENTNEKALAAIGDGITIAIEDFYEEHGKETQYQLQESLCCKIEKQDDFVNSWDIEIPGSYVVNALRFSEDGKMLWYVTYMCKTEHFIFIAEAKYWKDQKPDVVVHTFLC